MTGGERDAPFPNQIDARRASEYRRLGYWSDQTLADQIERHAAERGQEPAYITAAGRLSWTDYQAGARRVASALRALELARGDRALIRLPDSASFHVVLLGCELAGIVAVGIGARAGERELRHMVDKTRVAAVISHAQHRGEAMAGVVAALGVDHHVIVPRFEQDGADPLEVNGRPAAGHDSGDPGSLVAFERRIGPDELWMVNSTSGTTGLPKCVMHAQNRWHAFHRAAAEVADLTSTDVFMSVVPTPFGFGLWSAHFTPCYLGAPTVVTERFDATDTLDLLERERATVLSAVSTQFRMLLAEPTFERRDLSALRVMFTGGEPIPYAAARRFEQATGAAILNFYGSNESGFASATTIHDPAEKRLRTAGRAQPGTELRLHGDDGRPTSGGRGQPGTRGPAVCLGYLDDPVANQALFTSDGFLLHADIVELDDEGYLTVVGRKSDLIIRGGKNISAVEVEDEVSAHPRVALAAAVPMPDPIYGERVCVYVELRVPGELELAELCDFLLASGISKELLPERLVVLDRLPRSAGDKVAKSELREAAARLVA